MIEAAVFAALLLIIAVVRITNRVVIILVILKVITVLKKDVDYSNAAAIYGGFLYAYIMISLSPQKPEGDKKSTSPP